MGRTRASRSISAGLALPGDKPIGLRRSWTNGVALTSQRQTQPLAMLTHPADLPGGHTGHEGVGLDVLGDDGPGADEGVFAERDATHDRSVGPDRSPFPHQGPAVFVLARDGRARIVDVGEDHTGAAEDVVLEGHGVEEADVVLDLAATADDNVVGHEDMLPERAIGADAGTAADVYPVLDAGPVADRGAVVDDGGGVGDVGHAVCSTNPITMRMIVTGEWMRSRVADGMDHLDRGAGVLQAIPVYDRLHLIANNSRFLILPAWHVANLASRVLALCERRVSGDWQARFGYPLWLLETFVDPRRFHGTSYRAANWLAVGETRGFRRTRAGYSNRAEAPKRVFVRPLIAHARARLAHPVLDPRYHHGAPKLMLSAEQMRSLPGFFADVPDPRRPQGRRHPLPVVLAIAAGAVLCGARGYKAIAAWAQDLGQAARACFRCRYRNGRYEVPSRTRIRDVLTRVDPDALGAALQGWNAQMAAADEGLAIDGKTMCHAIDADGRQTHILGVVGHQTQACHTQKSRLAARRWK